MGRRKLANCRRCVHFVPLPLLDEGERERIYRIAEREKLGKPLGLCKRRNKPVYWLIGECAFYARKRPKILALDGRVIEW